MIFKYLKLLLFLVYILSLISASAQVKSDVCTPKGTSVIAYIIPENTDYWREYYDAYYANAYPNATQIQTYDGFSSTRKFNCHGYAWHIADGGSDRWIGIGGDNDPEYGYWQDGSYIETAQSVYPGKVNWSSGDHSAITTENPGLLISKWNEYPLMRHAWDDSPYGTSNLKYYKLNFSILGPSTVCSSGATFTINNLPPVNSIEWTCGPYLSVSSGQNTDSCTFVVTGTGNSSINAQIYTTCGNSYLLQTPVLVYSSPTGLGMYNFNNLEMIDEWGTMFKILPSSGAYAYRGSLTVSGMPNSSYRWTQLSSYPNDIGWSANGATVDVYTRFANKTVTLRCTETNSCTSSYKNFTFTTSDLIVSISPNPATGETTIFIESSNEDTKDISSAEWDMEIYDQSQQLKMKQAKLKGNEFKLNTSGWKDGVYIVRAKVGDKLLSEKLVVKQ